MISRDTAERVLAKSLSTGGDFAEIFAEDTLSSAMKMVDDKLDTAISGRIFGVGIRIFKGLRSVYSTTSDLSEQGLIACAGRAAAAIGDLKTDISVTLNPTVINNIHPILITPSSVEISKKADIVKSAYSTIKNYSPEIVQAVVNLVEKDQNVLIANSEGVFTSDRRVYTRLINMAVASDGKENQTGTESPGRMMGFEAFENEIDPKETAKSAAATAVTMLHAENCAAGRMTVAIENGFGGVIFHEACGHSLEATSVSKNSSEFCGKLGQKIACDKFTAIDDGTIPNSWGSINIDDEGSPAKRNVLIENGVLKSYLIDKMGARRMNAASTGSGRRESYQYSPTSRMTNTYIANGPDNNEDIISSIETGLYAKKMGGGSVNPATGEFNFAVMEGYMVRNGKICEPVRGASLIGKGSEILMNIDMIGTNMAQGAGMCGSLSGSVPVNVGQPLVRVSVITVGGR